MLVAAAVTISFQHRTIAATVPFDLQSPRPNPATITRIIAVSQFIQDFEAVIMFATMPFAGFQLELAITAAQLAVHLTTIHQQQPY